MCTLEIGIKLALLAKKSLINVAIYPRMSILCPKVSPCKRMISGVSSWLKWILNMDFAFVPK